MAFDTHTVLFLRLAADAPTLPEPEAAALQDAHLAHQAGLAEQGHIAAVGPLTDQQDERLRGIVLLTVDQATARRLYADDPAVRAGRLEVETATWLVPAGMLTFNRVPVPASVAEAFAD